MDDIPTQIDKRLLELSLARLTIIQTLSTHASSALQDKLADIDDAALQLFQALTAYHYAVDGVKMALSRDV